MATKRSKEACSALEKKVLSPSSYTSLEALDRSRFPLYFNEMGIYRGLTLLLLWGVACGCSTASTEKKRELTKVEKAWLYIQAANAALVEGDPTGALQSLVRAEEIDKNIPELHHSKALAYYGKRDLNSALDSVRRAIELSPNFSDANNTYGKMLMEAHREEEALIPLQKAAQDHLYRDAFKAWTNLGVIRFRQNRPNEALVYFEHAILDAPEKSCIAYYYRGQIQEKEHKLVEAIDSYRHATRRFCANFGEAQLALGYAYQKNRDYPLARKIFLGIHERFPNSKLAERAMEQLRFLP